MPPRTASRPTAGAPAFTTFKTPGTKKATKSPKDCAMHGFKRAAGMGKGQR